jgi:hypothetical protein
LTSHPNSALIAPEFAIPVAAVHLIGELTMKTKLVLLTLFLAGATTALPARPALAQNGTPVDRLADRGPGQATSMFGSYIRKGEFLMYPFFEYYLDNDYEYKPEEFGYNLARDFRGKFRANEGILFIGYGITERLAVEFEAAVIDARFEKSPDDNSGVPDVIEERGSGDIEGQIRYRFLDETETRPEMFTYFEAVSPQQKDKLLIATPDWELKFGAGMIRATRVGTFTLRAGAEYLLDDQSWDLGEYAVEYLKRVSPQWRLFAGFEGTQDELSLITEAQWHFSPFAYLKLNNGLGVTSKATDWAPEIGIMLSHFPKR